MFRFHSKHLWTDLQPHHNNLSSFLDDIYSATVPPAVAAETSVTQTAKPLHSSGHYRSPSSCIHLELAPRTVAAVVEVVCFMQQTFRDSGVFE